MQEGRIEYRQLEKMRRDRHYRLQALLSASDHCARLSIRGLQKTYLVEEES